MDGAVNGSSYGIYMSFRQHLKDILPGLDEDRCNVTRVPTAWDWICGVETQGFAWTIGGVVAAAVTCVLFLFHFVALEKWVSHGHSRRALKSLAMVPPGIAVTGLVGAVVPRAVVLAEAGLFLWATRALFLFSALLRAYAGGSFHRLASTLKEESLALKSPPCCCCCTCLPQLPASRSRLRCLSRMLNQGCLIMPLCSSLLFPTLLRCQDLGLAAVVRLVGRLDRPLADPFHPLLLVPAVLVQISLLGSLYALMMLSKVTQAPLKEYRAIVAFRLMMATLLTTQLPKAVTEIVFLFGLFPCTPLIQPKLHAETDVESTVAEGSEAGEEEVVVGVTYLLTTAYVMCGLSLAGTWLLGPQRNAIFDGHPKRRPTVADANPSHQQLLQNDPL